MMQSIFDHNATKNTSPSLVGDCDLFTHLLPSLLRRGSAGVGVYSPLRLMNISDFLRQAGDKA